MVHAPSPTPADPALTPRAGSSLLALWAFALAACAARIAYLVWLCPYDLVEDEAQYWLWAKNLSWSYYSKGPGIAWAIALTTGLYADHEWSVRLVAAFSGLVSTLAVGGLARDIARAQHHPRPGRIALWVGAAWAIAPFVQMSAILSTIDGPLLACWALAAWLGWRAIHLRSRAALVGLGAAVGAGFLFKYTMLLIVPGLIAYAWWFARRTRAGEAIHAAEATRNGRMRAAMLASCLLAAAALAPVVLWNAQHHWVTIRHLMGHLNISGVGGDNPVSSAPGDSRRWFEWLPVWPLGLALMQVGMAGPALIVGAAIGWRALRDGRHAGTQSDRHAGAAYLALLALPLILFYAVVAYVAEPEGNWPIAASVTLLPLAMLWWLGALAPESTDQSHARAARWGRRLCTAGLIYGLLAIPLLHRADLLVGLFNRAIADQTVWNLVSRVRGGKGPEPIVLGRLIGGRAMGQDVTQVLADLQTRTGARPFVLSQHYGRASLMAFYVAWPGASAGGENPAAIESYCSGVLTGGRMSHFDFMPSTDLSNPSLRGRPAVILSNDRPEVLARWRTMFESVAPAPDSSAVHDGRLRRERKRDRVVYIATGFKGVPAPDSAAH